MKATLGVPDYHVHSRFSDGRDDLAACAERAFELGVPELGFAEHLTPFAPGTRDFYGLDPARLGDYVAAVEDVAASCSTVRVVCGVEIDYVPGAADDIAALLAAQPFGYVLCSVHFVDGFSFDLEENRGAEEWRSPDRLLRRYWEMVREAAASGLFHAVAHLDLIKMWGHRPASDLRGAEEEALAAIAAAGMLVEVNTAGLDRHPVREIYPSQDLLRRALAAGIGVTFGSDAHRAAEIASSFAEAVRWARAAGYDSYVRLSDGAAVELP